MGEGSWWRGLQDDRGESGGTWSRAICLGKRYVVEGLAGDMTIMPEAEDRRADLIFCCPVFTYPGKILVCGRRCWEREGKMNGLLSEDWKMDRACSAVWWVGTFGT